LFISESKSPEPVAKLLAKGYSHEEKPIYSKPKGEIGLIYDEAENLLFYSK
jgi:hypothetical protein